MRFNELILEKYIYFHVLISVLVQKSLKLSPMLLFWEGSWEKTAAKKKTCENAAL